MENIHTRAYTLDEKTGEWEKHGVVIRNGFWPMNQPVKMPNGNWIMPGISAGPYSNDRVFPAAVAISHGDDFTKWDFVKIPVTEGIERMWGESAIFVDGNRIYNIARYGGGAFGVGCCQRRLRSVLDPLTDQQSAHGDVQTHRGNFEQWTALFDLHDGEEQRRQAQPAHDCRHSAWRESFLEGVRDSPFSASRSTGRVRRKSQPFVPLCGGARRQTLCWVLEQRWSSRQPE